eukprot:2139271-Pyramimonas_sp.AAC.1
MDTQAILAPHWPHLVPPPRACASAPWQPPPGGSHSAGSPWDRASGEAPPTAAAAAMELPAAPPPGTMPAGPALVRAAEVDAKAWPEAALLGPRLSPRAPPPAGCAEGCWCRELEASEGPQLRLTSARAWGPASPR